MKIAYDYQTVTSQSYGGVSRYFSKIIGVISKSDNKIKVFSQIYKNNYIKDMGGGIIDGLYVKNYPPKTQKLVSLFNQVISSRKINKWKPDVVHETYYSRLSSGKICGVRIITVLDMIHELFPENYKGNDNTSNIKKKALARADHIFCISQNTKKDLMNILNIQDKKITVVHLGVDIRECERTKKNNSYSKPYLLYVGKRFGYKNFSRFLLAVGESTLLKRNFNIIAFGGGAFSSDEVDLITKVGLSARQVIHINGNDQMLQNLYSNASAFIYPSLYEGFGLPPLEAMACGCPVISSNTSSMPEVISNAGVYFNPNSVDDIRYQIERTVFDDELLDNLIAKGCARAKNFTWKKCADKTLKAYQLALGKC